MSWIKMIDYDAATKSLQRLYDRVKGENNNVDNVLKIHSLRPHSLTGHMTLYKNVLHHAGNTLPKWFLECIGVYVSYLNACDYCVKHHSKGLGRLWNDDDKLESFMASVKNGDLVSFFKNKEFAAMQYAKKLTLNIHEIKEHDVLQLKRLNYDDGEILEINQVVSYFNYVNRTVVGLGVNTEGDVLGLSPNDNDDDKNWGHK